MPRNQNRSNVFFRLLIVVSLLFIFTVLALAATMFGDPRSPANRWLDRYGTRLIAAEVAGIIVCAVAAMTLDRWRRLREERKEPDDRHGQ